MFMDQKNQYYKDVSVPQIQCNGFNAILIKIPSGQADTKIYLEMQRTYNGQNSFGKEEKKCIELTLPDLKTYDKTVIIKTLWY